MPLRKCTRSVVFIDTNSAEKRVALLKSFTDLQHLPKNSTNIEADNVLKRYKRRPKKLNYCIYADFVSWYDTVYSARPKKCVSMESELPEDDEENNDDTMSESENENENNSDIIEFRDGTLLRKRKRQKVLRYNKVSENENKEEHYRQLLMLFTSWRNEEYDLLNECNSFYESYQKMEDIILGN